ncbi:glycoside hydrolase domain-containing protein [Eleftheria terrae]|uniref:glycoside hydrolase domain-containing protein n=1 Tax=Eleftheria terrae TaxID=1597781 RepID=UPI00263BC999|nr:glycoside hydrolase domain-containing protein [Eleftheria terrae]WKB55635.1 DUF1906 domain-containing protein [Eleftheria terrae]
MTFYNGFDTGAFPGMRALAWLKAETSLVWCGYYLAPAPSHSDTSWGGQRAALVEQGWGLAPVYLGQQTAGPGSRNATGPQGRSDGAQAAVLARREGFPTGSTLYLDWEDGSSPGPDALAYIRTWMAGLVAAGYAPGLYCSHELAAALLAQVAAPLPGPPPRIWAWRVATAAAHPYLGDIRQLAAADPAGCGDPQAALWQFEQNAVLALPGTPCDGLQLDLSHSSLPDPSAP